MPAPINPINITLKMPPTPPSTHTLLDWLPIIIGGVSVIATVVLGIVVVLLNNRNARQLEQLKADIGRDITEHQIRFSNIHQKRIDIITQFSNLMQTAVSSIDLSISNVGAGIGAPRPRSSSCIVS